MSEAAPAPELGPETAPAVVPVGAAYRATRNRERNFVPYEHVVSVSGGKDSTALYCAAVERGEPFRAVFADTGNEHEATYEAVNRLAGAVGGPPIQTVKRDFSGLFARRREYIATKWPQQGIPAEKVERALKVMHPTGNPFLDLCIIKGRFPSAKARFCTEDLKIVPMFLQVQLPALLDGRAIISWQGVRADESKARSGLPKWQRINPPWNLRLPEHTDEQIAKWRLYAYRPLIKWTVEDVFAMHDRHGIARNPLYDAGFRRVGCFPCIMENKEGLRLLSKRFPEHIDRLEEWESIVSDASKLGISTFFNVTDDPLYSGLKDKLTIDVKTQGIRNRVQWSMTDRGGHKLNMFTYADYMTSCNQWGACE